MLIVGERHGPRNYHYLKFDGPLQKEGGLKTEDGCRVRRLLEDHGLTKGVRDQGVTYETSFSWDELKFDGSEEVFATIRRVMGNGYTCQTASVFDEERGVMIVRSSMPFLEEDVVHIEGLPEVHLAVNVTVEGKPIPNVLAVAIRVGIPEAKSQAVGELCRLLDIRDHMRDQLEDINARIDACLQRNEMHETREETGTQVGATPRQPD